MIPVSNNQLSILRPIALGIASFFAPAHGPSQIASAQDPFWGRVAELYAGPPSRAVQAQPIRDIAELRRCITQGPDQVHALQDALKDPTAVTIFFDTLRPSAIPDGASIELRDGSQLALSSAFLSQWPKTGRDGFTVESISGHYKLPLNAILAIRPQPDPEYDFAWESLVSTSRNTKADILVIKRPTGVLDTLTGILKGFSSSHISFIIDGDDSPTEAALGRVEGVICTTSRFNPDITAHSPVGEIQIGSHRIPYTSLAISADDHGEACEVVTPSGAELRLPLAPMVVHRSLSLTYSLQGLFIKASRTPGLRPDSPEVPPGQRLVTALPPRVYTVQGTGAETELRIYGPATLQIQLPDNPSLLYWLAEFPRDGAEYFSLRLADSSQPLADSAQLLYRQERFDAPSHPPDTQQRFELPANGQLVIEVGGHGEVYFPRFVLLKGN